MLRTILLFLAIGLLAFLVWRLGPSEIVQLLGRIGWYSLLALLLYSGQHALRALALRACVLRRGVLGYGEALAIRLSGEAIQALTFTGPALAEPTRAWLLKRRGLTLQEGFAATITEYLISSFVGAGMSIAALVFLVQLFQPRTLVTSLAICTAVAFSLFLAASAVAITRRFYLIGTIIAGLARIGVLRGRLRPDMAWINRMEDLLLAVLRDRPRRLVAVLLLEAAAQTLLVLELLWLLHALQIPAAFSAFVIEGSVKVIGIAFPFIPLHVGVAEGGYALVFDAMGLAPAAGFTIAFARRVRSLVVASIGLALLAHLTREDKPIDR